MLPLVPVSSEVPVWPLVRNPDRGDREMELWAGLWCKPQSDLWRLNDQLLEVALYVRCFAEAELPDASAQRRLLVRQQADALLLTIPAMRAARVRIVGDDLGKRRRESAPQAVTAVPSSRSRLQSVPDVG